MLVLQFKCSGTFFKAHSMYQKLLCAINIDSAILCFTGLESWCVMHMLQYGNASQQAAFQGVQSLSVEAGRADGHRQTRHVCTTETTQWPMSVS